MKTLLDKATRDELIARINILHEGCVAQWGKMDIGIFTVFIRMED